MANKTNKALLGVLFVKESDARKENFTESAYPTMGGHTAEERATTQEKVAIIDQATSHFEVACRKGSAMFTLLEKQDIKASQHAFGACKQALDIVEHSYAQDRRFDNSLDTGPVLEWVSTADCVLFALLQFSIRLYDRDLTEGFPTLKVFYNSFEQRKSAAFGDKTFPMELKLLASHFLRTSASPFASILLVIDVLAVYAHCLALITHKQLVRVVRVVY